MDDLISRQAAKEAVRMVVKDLPTRTEINILINDLPSAQPERKTGKWLSHYEYCKKHKLLPSGSVAFWWCDQCEQGVEHPTNFCPNCGADMREGQDDT